VVAEAAGDERYLMTLQCIFEQMERASQLRVDDLKESHRCIVADLEGKLHFLRDWRGPGYASDTYLVTFCDAIEWNYLAN